MEYITMDWAWLVVSGRILRIPLEIEFLNATNFFIPMALLNIYGGESLCSAASQRSHDGGR